MCELSPYLKEYLIYKEITQNVLSVVSQCAVLWSPLTSDPATTRTDCRLKFFVLSHIVRSS